MATIVLVHGAWHGGWCWKRVTPLLRAAGHEVYTPTLTGLGDRVHLLGPDITLSTHIDDVVNLLSYEDLTDVLLVGHSYGGMVITGAAEKVPERLAHLVYLDAFVPTDGRSLIDYYAPEVAERWKARACSEGRGYGIPPTPPEVLGVSRDDDLAWVRPKLGQQPLRTFLDPVQLSNAAARDLPRTYIYCSSPWVGRVGPFGQFANWIRTDHDWHYLEMATGHDAMVTAPRELATTLIEIARTSTAQVVDNTG